MTIPFFINPSPADALPVSYARLSIPFRRGAFAQMPALQISDAAGRSIPFQSEVLAVWPDDSIRVAHLTLQAQGGPHEIHIGDQGKPVANAAVKTAITIEEGEAALIVSNGRLRAEFARGADAWSFPSLQLNNKELVSPSGIEARVIDESRRGFSSRHARDLQLEIETRGDLRTVIALRGKYALEDGETRLDFRLRFEFLAGVEGVSVSHAFFNLEKGSDFLPLQKLDLQFALSGGVHEYSIYQSSHGLFTTEGRIVKTTSALDVTVDNSMVPAHVENFETLGDDFDYPFYLKPHVHRVENWGALSRRDGAADVSTLLVEMDDFHLLRPKKLHLGNGKACFDLWPHEAGVLQLQQGRSRETTVRVALCDEEISAPEEVTSRITQMREVWRAQLPAAVYAEASFFDLGRVLPFRPSTYPRFERWLGALSDGMNSLATYWDLGDTPDSGYRSTYASLGLTSRFRGEDGPTRWFSSGYHHHTLALNRLEDFEPIWVNNEYDAIFCLGTEYLRVGDMTLFQKLRWFARHNIEVDFLHYSDHRWLHRASPAHSKQHTLNGAYPSHFWTQGLAQYYFLTADPDALEVIGALADKTIENMEYPPLRKIFGGLNREAGWGILTLMCAYEATNEKRYSDYARSLIDEIIHDGLPADIPVFSFCHGSLIFALRQYLQIHDDGGAQQHEACRPVRDFFLEFVDLGIACSLRAPGTSRQSSAKLGTYSTDNLWKAKGAAFDKGERDGIFETYSLVLDGLAYAFEITGDPKYVKSGLRSFEYFLDSSAWRNGAPEGKPYSMLYRTWMNFLQSLNTCELLEKWDYSCKTEL